MNAQQTPDQGSPHRRRTPIVLGAVLLVGALVTGAVAYGRSGGGASDMTAASGRSAGIEASPVALPVVTVSARDAKGLVPWQAPLSLRPNSGSITGVTGTDAAGQPVTGSAGADGSWTSAGTLLPGSPYALTVTVRDSAGRSRTVPVTVSTTPATKTVQATLIPGDGRVVGVGQPIAVRLDRPVTTAADRRAVQERLSVTTVPAVTGAWRWMDDRELHYRAADFWKPGTRINVQATLSKAKLSGGVWGSGMHTSSFSIGEALTSVVDVTAHTMAVSRGGKVLRVMKASMGRPGFETRRGTFIVLETYQDLVMDGSTLAVPADYKTAVKDAVRITNSGTFAHGAPWSVASQGKDNVSHGCINLSPDNAAWYFDQVKRGDVVKVINSPVAPLAYDTGSRDWNMSFAQWKSGPAAT